MNSDKGQCRYALDPLVEVMTRLRGDNGCPWDKEQNHQSLRPYLVEETYEVLEALDDGNTHKICDELGDLLLQVVFHAQIAAEEKAFDMNDVVQAVTKKMIRRHPHVFGDTSAQNSAEVLVNWDKIKEQERGQIRQSVLEGIPKGLPALSRATKLQAKAAKVGFDWPDYRGALEKLAEELAELGSAIKSNAQQEMYNEMGDVLFAVVNIARLLDIDAESALTSTNNKFMRRFQYIEQKSKQRGKILEEMSLEEMDSFWNEAKGLERAPKGKNIK